jgi:integrase
LGVADISSHSFRKTVATLIDDAGLSARIGADRLAAAMRAAVVSDPRLRDIARRLRSDIAAEDDAGQVVAAVEAFCTASSKNSAPPAGIEPAT